MVMILKAQGKRVTALFLLLACFFTLVFSQSAYAASDSNMVTLSVEQVFTKPASSSAAGTFTYKLTAKETDNPMPSGSSSGVYTFTISGTDSVNIGPIYFTRSGVYNYEVEQYIKSPKTGYTYDTQVYTITVYIDSALNVNIIIYKQNGVKTDCIVFENEYTPLPYIPSIRHSDPFLMVDLPVNKSVLGNPETGSTFTFKLEAQDKSNPMPTGSSGGVKTITIVGSGTRSFGTWNYTEAGNYYYMVSEVNTGESGYTYDTTVYTITDSVKDEGGELVLTRMVTNDSNKLVNDLAFVNKYATSGDGDSSGGDRDGGGTTEPKPLDGGATGPKTSDDAMTGPYQAMFGIGGFVLMACIAYLIMAGNRRKKESINK